ncbi:MAG TPA: D-ribose pyranase [Clostridia bacterium]|nr:D-ribose pyranase [Clostridia bacterium]
MKKDRILNPELISAIASIGHTEYFVIADAGLPIPQGIKVIDLTLTRGIPGFIQTLKAISEELVVESYIIAGELPDNNPGVYEETRNVLSGLPAKVVAHEQLKELLLKAKAVCRTGETTPYSNVILVAGVNF